MGETPALFRAAFFSSAILLSGLTVSAQTSPGNITPSPSPAPPIGVSAVTNLNTLKLLNFLHHVNNIESTEAMAALQRSENPQVRSYAQTILDDHQQNEQLVLQAAAQKGIPIFAFQPSTMDIATDSFLRELIGPQYDYAFNRVQQTEHQRVLQDLRFLQSLVNDPDLQNLVNQTIPVIQKHINLARSIPPAD